METYSSSKTQSWLSWFLKGLLIFGFFILFARLADLQIIRGSYFKSLSEGNRIRRVSIEAPRGKITARGGETLVGNREVKKRIVFHPDSGYEKTFDIGDAEGDEIIYEPLRDYVLGSVTAHIGGYLGEVNEDEVGKVNPECLDKGPRRFGALVGRSGVEQSYECILSGFNGEELIEVDSQGVKIRTLGRREPVPGEDLRTNIDYGLQKKVGEVVDGVKGVVIVSDTKGEVLALYSSPSYDPNTFVNSQQTDLISEILNNKDLPLFNRAIGGIYHPGSLIKPIISIAALEEGKIDEDFLYEDTGQITVDSPYGRFSYNNWYFTQYGGVEGKIGLTRAIARSTDTFFYKLGEFLQIEKIDKWSNKFNLDDYTGIDIPGEVAGLVPSPEWKLRVKGERWFLGNTYHVSIGQGDMAITPLAINAAIAAIAFNGKYCPPHVAQSEDVDDYKCRDLGISEKSIDLVKEGMMEACSNGGTGYPFFDAPEKVACKTGTAEIDDGSDDTHAWFTFFVPIEKPEVVVTVLVERGGEGSSVAGPIAREIYDHWFEHRNKE